ncbi:SMC-Scp complex subunit ScpB [Tsukamurella sp. 8F]|uniref:SMC-Scp complex subunit ScpB n=1 Tax=unclassified Tsukamurella TaxID=2633480 RepID=UPI0023B96DF7|nr:MULTISPECIES: SMC-Scp complex subunit ScpB [unclassified Tsukamurella]MDF0532225.1 SMC-Scp complex subunit ScpB [Tsukamurella sp. 8J]MDF0588070.1 SMC-Scp complex subunit ScpB [Tsukamurella sp. 8F]
MSELNESRGVDLDGPDNDGSEVPEEDLLADDELRAALEALLLVVDAPATVGQLSAALEQPPHRVSRELGAWRDELAERGSGMDLRSTAEGWRLYTRAEYAPYVERLLLDGARSKLTRAALETLAVIAYRQPVSRAKVSAVRGVNVDGVMRTLLARGLIAEAGTDPDSSATAYATTELFLERIGLGSLDELPPLGPLLPEVDVIDDLSGDLDSDPRFARLARRAAGTPGDSDAFDPDA